MVPARDNLSHEVAELVFALVAPVGTDLNQFVETMVARLKEFNYTAEILRLGDMAAWFRRGAARPRAGSNDEFRRINRRMDAGNAARKKCGADILALAAAGEISGRRLLDGGKQKPTPRRAYLLRSLKHPDEALTLRRIYGPGFFLLGVVSSIQSRTEFLQQRKGCTTDEVQKLFERDEAEDGVAGDLGQRTRDTFQLADVFLPLDDPEALTRFLNLVFGNPFETPSRDEYAMFLAFSAAVRSGDLSRQVGAVVLSSMGDVIAVGTNDVPAVGGGLAWPGPGDPRDLALGFETNAKERKRIIDEVLAKLKPDHVSATKWQEQGWARLKHAAIMDITEYGRAVHAEMEAILSCARSGISTKDASLFSTTFPCHNCAKHILAAGIRRVVYVEPYPKSQAAKMYPQAINLDGRSIPGSVPFLPFVGLGPRSSSTCFR